MSNIIGTCSLCGGPVERIGLWMNPGTRCINCGAVGLQSHKYGPVIPMQPMPSTGTVKCSTCGGGFGPDGLHYCTGITATTGGKP